ncbi:MAG: outer membrane protein assembly factor BamE [Halieaceae bacterium]|uniref:outer membrane protein assembly factor BamE domain-containing protein n=1 Tax=Haliea alexandrii TaxID=2448162 RepID=UPI000F0B2DA9|nr:outer membrane protein assembly factor BamE [Haliea alexandrii]MCR9184352.1 outer membrane protein assembly factor BamE [Halieaceae bacterium]
MKRVACLLLPALLLTLAGCAQYENRRGVEVGWTDAYMQSLQPGVTTRAEVMATLGPPSQVIALEGESILYYLFERSDGEGIVLVLYNRMQIDTHYDRAIFFFDEDGLLTDASSRIADTDNG